MMKQRLAWILALLMAGCTVVSCGETASDNGNDNAETQHTPAQTEAVTEAPSVLDAFAGKDFDGYTVNVLLYDQEDSHTDMVTEGKETGDVLNDIVFRRNRAIEELCNIHLEAVRDSDANVASAAKKEVTAGINDHDLFFSNITIMPLASGGYLYALNDLPHVDLSAAWWDQAALTGLSIGGDVYMATGDISPSSLMTSSCLVFNKKLFAANDMELPYQTAAEGKWTLDKLAEMTKGLTQDLNGDGKLTFEDDLFSFSSWCYDSPYSLFYGAGGMLSRKNAEDIPESFRDLDKITAVYETIFSIIHGNESYFVTDIGQYPTTYELFANGKAYFCEIMLRKIDSNLRDMADDYGILPIPKWDEAQETYLSCVNGAGALVVVPKTAEDPERTGFILEALAAGSSEIITPSLYNVITKSRNVRDAESADMVELITHQRVFDPVYMNSISGYNFIQTMLQGKKTDVASTLAKSENSAEKALNKLVDAYLSIEK